MTLNTQAGPGVNAIARASVFFHPVYPGFSAWHLYVILARLPDASFWALMNELIQFVLRHGYWVVGLSVFLEQLGIPLPAVPVLLAVGAFSRTGEFSFTGVLISAFAGSIVADLIWFYLGRLYGRSVVKFVCRVSMEPDTCMRRAEDAFTRLGGWTVSFGKFVPGLNAAAVTMAGMLSMNLLRFLCFDGIGVIMWAGAYAGVGYIFSAQIESVIIFVSQLGNSVLALAIVLVAAWLGRKYIQRQNFLKTLQIARITPEQLKQKLDAHEDIVIVDLRHKLDYEQDGSRIPGALHLLPQEVQKKHREFPRNRDVVLYCTCPNEAMSAQVAIMLQRRGIVRARPLEGGLQAWRDKGFPLDSIV
jgi:membrane protein DedA with SNARE-associated domain/rhodanese-related sulfurtransferase